MGKSYWIFIFLLVLCIHVTGILAGKGVIENSTKPLIIPILAGYFIVSTKAFSSALKKWVLLALLFSWIGDILLQFVTNDSTFFLAGLSAFLIAHIFYILFFHSVRVKENIAGKSLLLLPVLIYYVSLMILLSPHLHDMKLPVRMYGVVICFMLMLALHMLYIKNKKASLMMMTGALLFVISDSALAINKFYTAFEGAGVIIMLAYGVAQLLITEGAIKYIANSAGFSKGY